MTIHTRTQSGPRTAKAFVAGAVALVLAAAIAALPSTGSAQSSSSIARSSSQLDARWQPWIGCWKPAPPQGAAVTFGSRTSGDAPLVCVVPSASSTPSTVDVLTVADGKVSARDTIQATGRSVARTKDGCTGVESAKWSADGQRLFVSSDFACPGGIKRTSSGIFAMSPAGEWVNVQGVDVGGNRGVSVLHYRDAGLPATLPPEISAALRVAPDAGSSARAAAGAPLSAADIVEASHSADSTVVEALVMDRGQAFSLSASEIVALADAGVPGNVTDAMVALTYPKAFALAAPSEAGSAPAIESSGRASGSDADQSARRNVEVIMAPAYSPYNYSPFGYLPYDYYGYGYSPYGYSPYGYSPYGYSPYGAPLGYAPYLGYGGGAYGGYFPPPVIVLRGSGQPTSSGGYVVTGHAHPRGASSGSSGATSSPRPTVSSPSSMGNNPPPPPPPRQPESSGGRTAHPRP
jgi:hypothetical protein